MSCRPRAEPSRRAVAAPLVKQEDPTTVVAWYCTNCGTVHKTQDDAERCAQRKGCTEWTCEECGEPAFAPYQWYCHKCRAVHQRQREEKELAEALEVIPAAKYPSEYPVVYDGEFYPSVEDLIEAFEEDGCEVPKRVWATSPRIFQLDALSILESYFHEWVEEGSDADVHNLNGIAAFELAIEHFNAEQDVTHYLETRRVAVDIAVSEQGSREGPSEGKGSHGDG